MSQVTLNIAEKEMECKMKQRMQLFTPYCWLIYCKMYCIMTCSTHEMLQQVARTLIVSLVALCLVMWSSTAGLWPVCQSTAASQRPSTSWLLRGSCVGQMKEAQV